jgi:hypothetical protein
MEMPIAEVKPGMVLGRNLVQGGQTLLSEGTILTAGLIATIQGRGIPKLDVLNETNLPPGAEIFNIKSLDLRNDPDYVRERAELDALFGAVRPDDGQMMVLKYCLLRQLEERYHDR